LARERAKVRWARAGRRARRPANFIAPKARARKPDGVYFISLHSVVAPDSGGRCSWLEVAAAAATSPSISRLLAAAQLVGAGQRRFAAAAAAADNSVCANASIHYDRGSSLDVGAAAVANAIQLSLQPASLAGSTFGRRSSQRRRQALAFARVNLAGQYWFKWARFAESWQTFALRAPEASARQSCPSRLAPPVASSEP